MDLERGLEIAIRGLPQEDAVVVVPPDVTAAGDDMESAVFDFGAVLRQLGIPPDPQPPLGQIELLALPFLPLPRQRSRAARARGAGLSPLPMRSAAFPSLFPARANVPPRRRGWSTRWCEGAPRGWVERPRRAAISSRWRSRTPRSIRVKSEAAPGRPIRRATRITPRQASSSLLSWSKARKKACRAPSRSPSCWSTCPN